MWEIVSSRKSVNYKSLENRFWSQIDPTALVSSLTTAVILDENYK